MDIAPAGTTGPTINGETDIPGHLRRYHSKSPT